MIAELLASDLYQRPLGTVVKFGILSFIFPVIHFTAVGEYGYRLSVYPEKG